MYIEDYQNLINIITNPEFLKFYGSNAKLIQYHEHLIKFDKLLYSFFSEPNLNSNKLTNFLKSSIYNDYLKPSEELIEYYNSVRKNIKLTKLPEDLFYYKRKPLGIILPYHIDFFNLIEFSYFNKFEVYQIIKKLLDSLHELEDNGIYQLDLNYGKNVLYNGLEIQIVDLDGPYIKIGDELYSRDMYEQFVLTLVNLLMMCDSSNLKEFKNDIIKEKIQDYESSKLLVKELKKML